MASNLSEGIIQIFGTSVMEINDALRQIQIRMDAMKGLSGRAVVHDRMGVSDPEVSSDAQTLGTAVSLADDNRFDGKLGHQAAPVDPQTVDAVTNNVTVGGVDGTIADYASLVTYATDAAAIRNDIYQLARSVKQISDALRLYGFGI